MSGAKQYTKVQHTKRQNNTGERARLWKRFDLDDLGLHDLPMLRHGSRV
jgi:hypothetical protein